MRDIKSTSKITLLSINTQIVLSFNDKSSKFGMHVFIAAPKGEFNAWSVIASGTLDVRNSIKK